MAELAGFTGTEPSVRRVLNRNTERRNVVMKNLHCLKTEGLEGS